MSQRLLCQQWAEGSMYLCGIYFPLEGVPVYYLLGQTTYHIHVCANTCSCTCMAYTYMHTYIYIYMYVYAGVCIYMCLHIYIYMSIFGGSFVNPKLLDLGPEPQSLDRSGISLRFGVSGFGPIFECYVWGSYE